jgi:hypothetical protein
MPRWFSFFLPLRNRLFFRVSFLFSEVFPPLFVPLHWANKTKRIELQRKIYNAAIL